MKKSLFVIISAFALFFAFIFSSCTHNQENTYEDENETEYEYEYEDINVAKIETAYYGGYVRINSYPTRTFDFTTGKVTDNLIVDKIWWEAVLNQYRKYPQNFPEYKNFEEYEAFAKSEYNNPKVVTRFSFNNAKNLLNEIESLGIYSWEDKYCDYKADDLRWSYIKIIFSDGTEKRTDFYISYPSNMIDIRNAFNKYLGVDIMWQDTWWDFDL